MATVDVVDAHGNEIPLEKPLTPARKPAAESRPVVFSNEDKAALDLLAAILGAVDANPAANTVQDRLKSIVDSISSLGGYSDGLEVLATTLNGLVDGLETLVTSSNTKLDALNASIATTLGGYLDGLEALIGTSNASLATLQGHVDGLEAAFTTLNSKDFSTQTTLAALLAKVTADPATAAKQDVLIGHVDGLEAALATLEANDFATEATLAAVLAALEDLEIPAPVGASTEAKQDTAITALGTLATAAQIGEVDANPTPNTTLDRLKTLATKLDLLIAQTDGLEGLATTLNGFVDGLETLIGLTNSAFATLNAKDFATQATLVALLAKVIAAPSTEAKQDTLIAKDFATQATLAAILAKIIAAPATEATSAAILEKIIAAPSTAANQATLIAKDFATQATLVALLAKVIAAPATEAKQDTGNTALAAIQTAIQLLDNAISGNELQVDIVSSALPSGAATAANQALTNTAIADVEAAIDATSADPGPQLKSASFSFTRAVDEGNLLEVTLSLDTGVYADGEVMADTQAITNAVPVNGGTAELRSIQVLDEDDQGVAFDLIFLSANNSLGTENAAPSITDANARDILGRVRVGAGDYIDLGGSRIATLTNIGLKLKAAAASTTIYVGAIIRGIGTYTASGVRLKLGIE